MSVPTETVANGHTALLEPSGRAGALAVRALLTRIGAVLFSNGAYVAGAFGANVVLANALAPAEFGRFSVAMSVMIVAQELCGTGFDLAMVRLFAGESDPRRARALLDASLRIKLAAGGAVAAGLFAVAPWIAVSVLGEPTLVNALRWAAGGALATGFFHHTLARLQAVEAFSAYAWLRSGVSVGKLAMFVALGALGTLTLDSALATSVVVLVAGGAVALATFGRSAPAPDGPAVHLARWGDIIWHGRWIVVAHLLFALYARLDLLMLSVYRSPAEVGYYTVAWNLGFMIDLCTFSIITAMMPHASRIRSHRELWEYGRQTIRTCSMVGLALLPAVFLAGPAIRVLFPGYEPAAGIFRVLFVATALTLVTHPLYLIVYARDHVQPIAMSNLVLAVTAALGCWLLIPRLGMMGAAYATVGARAVNAALVAYLVWRELNATPASAAA